MDGQHVIILQVCGISFRMLNDSCVATAQYDDPGAAAIDGAQGNLTGSISVRSGSVDMTTAGVYVLMYSVTDASQNTATLNRTVTVTGFGCTNSTMLNYDSMATVEAGNCVAVAYGCTNQSSANFNASANSDRCRFGAACTGIQVTATPSAAAYPSLALTVHNGSAWCQCSSGFSGSYCEHNDDDCEYSTAATL